MIIRNNMIIVDINEQQYDYNPSNYLIVVNDNVIHKSTGLMLYESYGLIATERLNRFIELWGNSQVFQWGLVDCYFDGYSIRISDSVMVQIMNALFVAFFSQEDHPMGWLLWF